MRCAGWRARGWLKFQHPRWCPFVKRGWLKLDWRWRLVSRSSPLRDRLIRIVIVLSLRQLTANARGADGTHLDGCCKKDQQDACVHARRTKTTRESHRPRRHVSRPTLGSSATMRVLRGACECPAAALKARALVSCAERARAVFSSESEHSGNEASRLPARLNFEENAVDHDDCTRAGGSHPPRVYPGHISPQRCPFPPRRKSQPSLGAYKHVGAPLPAQRESWKRPAHNSAAQRAAIGASSCGD